MSKRLRATGDCYKAACDAITSGRFPASARMIHALVNGYGPLLGRRIGHAWVECDGIAFDYSKAEPSVLPAALYRLIGGVVELPGQYAEYTARETAEKMQETGVYAPWDLQLTDWELSICDSTTKKKKKQGVRRGSH